MELTPQALDILQFYIDAGADEFICDSPLNRFNEQPPVINNPAQASAVIDLSTKQKIAHIEPKIGTIEALREAEDKVSQVTNIEELKAALEAFDSNALKRTSSNTIFAEGKIASKIMLIGDTPGADEDRSGRCFIGASGALLDKMLKCIGLNREENIYLTYMINWYPPGNRLPNSGEISLALPFIKKHIELADPDIIICLGDIATKQLLHTSQSVTRLHGKWHEYNIDSSGKTIAAIPMFRPEYLLASPSQKGKAWEDLLKLKAKIKELGLA